MFKKIGDGIIDLIVILERWIKRTQELLAPAIKVGTIISAFYSVLAVILLFQKKMPTALIQYIREFPLREEIFTILIVISFATLVLSGGIIEVVRFCGFASEFSLPPRDHYYDLYDDTSVIGGLLELALAVLPFVVAATIIACAPTVFIIAHNIRKHTDI